MADGKTPAKPESWNRLTVYTLWVFAVATLALLLLRLFWRYRRGEKFAKDDIWMGIAIGPLMLRLAFIHISSIYLTVKFDRHKYPQKWMSQAEVDRRTLGAQMVLPGRVCYAAFLWCMKLCVLHWFEKVTGRSRPYGTVIDITYWTIWGTFIGVCLSTFLECRPIHLYWQAWPSPGRCVAAEWQLVTMGVLNIITDIFLVCIPIPLLWKSRLPLARKLQLGLLFSVSAFVMAITVIRMPLIVGGNSMQKTRTFWATIECFASAVVANAPMFNTMLHRARGGSRSTSEEAGCPTNATRGRRARMPVTAQDSIGSLTRNDGLESIIEPSSSGKKKVYGDDDDEKGKVYRAPWHGDWGYNAELWSTNPYDQFPAAPAAAKLKTNFTMQM